MGCGVAAPRIDSVAACVCVSERGSERHFRLGSVRLVLVSSQGFSARSSARHKAPAINLTRSRGYWAPGTLSCLTICKNGIIILVQEKLATGKSLSA